VEEGIASNEADCGIRGDICPMLPLDDEATERTEP